MAAEELAGRIGQTAEACEALGVARSTLYRRRQPVTPKPKRRPRPHRALDETEREEVLGALHCERFVDKAPAQVWATLLDEGTYLCSIRTMYRILEEHGEVRERRNQRRHPNYTKPELLAEAPNQVWSWDITKLRGPVKWTYYYLYVILDIFSRYVVGWMLAHRESAALAQRLIAESCRKQDIEPDQLTLHADRGSSMRSKPVGLLLADLGVALLHGSDNPNGISKLRFWGKNAESMESVSYQHSCNNAKRSWEKRLFTLDLEPALGGVTISSMDSTNPVTVTAAERHYVHDSKGLVPDCRRN